MGHSTYLYNIAKFSDIKIEIEQRNKWEKSKQLTVIKYY